MASEGLHTIIVTPTWRSSDRHVMRKGCTSSTYQVISTEEKNLGPDSYRDVQAACLINICLSLFSDHHFSLKTGGQIS